MPGAFPETLKHVFYLELVMKGELAVPGFYYNEINLVDQMRYDDE